MVCATLIFGSTADEEEFRFAVLSAWLYVRGAASGTGGSWTPLLGFGIPQPFVPNFTVHPLTAVLAILGPVAWARVLIVTHTLVGAAGVWQVGRVLAVSPIVCAVATWTFLLASPVQNYLLADFWPSHYLVWTLAPWALAAAWRLADSETTDPWRWTGTLALSVGVAAANANPAYLLVYSTIVLALIVARWPAAWNRARFFAIAMALAAAMALPPIVQLARERQYFASELSLSNVTEPLTWTSAGAAFLPAAAVGPRALFLGAPFAVLCLAGCVLAFRRRPELVLAALFSAFMAFTAWVPVPVISQRYQFRDPLILCAIALAAIAAERLLRDRRFRWVAWLALAAQLAAVLAGSWPYVARAWRPDLRRATVFRGATAASAIVDRLVASMPVRGRVLYSPRVDHDVAERGLVEEGLGVNALAYRSVPVVNGVFKAVSADPIWPNDRLFYGRISTPAALIATDTALDVLGIRYVIARAGEPVAPELRLVASVEPFRGDDLVLYENDHAWPPAFLTRSIDAAALPLVAGCPNDRLLCRDWAAVAASRDVTPVRFERARDRIRVNWTPAPHPRFLVLSEMFRPEWKARVGNMRVETRAAYGALIGLPVPAGATDAVLEYAAPAGNASRLIAYAALVASVSLIGWRRFVMP